MTVTLRRVLMAAFTALVSILLGAMQDPAAGALNLSCDAYSIAYDSHGGSASVAAPVTERGPPVCGYDVTTCNVIGLGPHGTSVRSDGPSTPATIRASQATNGPVAGAPNTTSGHVRLPDGASAMLPTDGVAAKSGFNIVPGGSGTRAINFKPNAADPNWGLTSAHLNKHMFGTGKNSLRTIDAGGNPDRWRNYMQDLAARPVTNTLKGGIEDIIGTFPKADGSGTFQFGIRIAPSSNGSYDLVTLLTRQ